MNTADLPHLVIGACMNVHRALGPGLTQDAYVECLAIELREMEFDFKRQVPLEFTYHGRTVQTATRLDFVIGDSLLLLVRAQEEITRLQQQELESKVRLGHFQTGLIVNFNVGTLRKGIHQITVKRRAESEKADS
ncbi:GxxExxY protein [Prosthecobacter sp.]|uniref:GxxExxY protein n=1 Tax=Prosthecobacter sp. TaxID=1965333 RepID=UPI002487A3D9|nr:GxxExxY protein [Prosthecobacter sp.]MDI1314890.1 GxxExxY protein [Prosthecobacter sp.]